MKILNLIEMSFYAAAGMFWEMFWALILGFALSGVVIAFFPKKRVAKALGGSGLKELGLAMLFGAASSSCSYAAAAMARSLFQKGAHIITALAFMLASTNLVIELSAILWVLMGWQFVAAEFLGGVILVLIMAGLMKFFGPIKDFEAKRSRQKIEDHGHDHSDGEDDEGKIYSPKTLDGWRAAARAFVMEWKMIGKDIFLGVVISGFLMTCVPDSFWNLLFLHGKSGASLENALLGPLVSILSFVCSVGNIPMAGVLFRGGITFGGALSFIYADLIIIPLILVYRRYYGWRLALWITAIFYISMVLAALIVEFIFKALQWVPKAPEVSAMMPMDFFKIDYTFYLNMIFLVIAGILYWLSRASPANQESEHCCHHE